MAAALTDTDGQTDKHDETNRRFTRVFKRASKRLIVLYNL